MKKKPDIKCYRESERDMLDFQFIIKIGKEKLKWRSVAMCFLLLFKLVLKLFLVTLHFILSFLPFILIFHCWERCCFGRGESVTEVRRWWLLWWLVWLLMNVGQKYAVKFLSITYIKLIFIYTYWFGSQRHSLVSAILC